MTTETHFGNGSLHATTPSVIHHDAGGWILAALADHHRELVLTVEADERFWRIRRTHGNTASLFEAPVRHASASSARDIAAALARWAATAGLHARVHTDSADPVRVSLARHTES